MNEEIFSFHLAATDPLTLGRELFLHRAPGSIPGLMHSESMVSMRLGAPVFQPSRYGISQIVFFARWNNEKALTDFLSHSELGNILQTGWHVRLKFYRRWGFISELENLPENSVNPNPDGPVVGITLARLKLSEAIRFLRWGKPVEKLVRDHPGNTFAVAATRPLNTLSTFSIWRTEKDMLQMVHGKTLHADAMDEQFKKSFHHEFSTMRFYSIGEYGSWNNRSDYVPKI